MTNTIKITEINEAVGNALAEVEKIIVHPGSGHRDDWLSAAIVVGYMKLQGLDLPPIIRKDPTQEELDSKYVMVIDAGLVHDPELLNFDHHHFDKDHDPICALSLILEWLGLYSTASSVFKWMEATEIADSKGPIVLGDTYDVGSNRLKKRLEHLSENYDIAYEDLSLEGSVPPRDAIMRLASPIENFVLSKWSRKDCHTQDSNFYKFMTEFGVNTIETIDYINERHSELYDKGNVYDLDSIKVFDASFIAREDNPTFYLEDYVSDVHPDVAVTVTQDDRGEGFSLFRRNDHPDVDFSVFSEKLKSGKYSIKDTWSDKVIFSHVGGFIAKTTVLPRDEANELIRAALV